MRAPCVLCAYTLVKCYYFRYIVILIFKYVIDKRKHAEFDLLPTCICEASDKLVGVPPPFCNKFPRFHHPVVECHPNQSIQMEACAQCALS